MYGDIETKKQEASDWFFSLRNHICKCFEEIEEEFGGQGKFERKKWERDGGGGGEMSLMLGSVFEKVGVNVSVVFGHFSENFAREIPGGTHNKEFWASGVSVVAHMLSPFIPAIHMNTRMIVTNQAWFGGGTDLTPTFCEQAETDFFHDELRKVCDRFDVNYYPKFKAWCDEYFFLPNRNESRGIGGIFYDNLNTNSWQNDFAFNKSVGLAVPLIFRQIVAKKIGRRWCKNDKEAQLTKRGRYVEFNLLYDRGTRFGLMTHGNTEAILMSLPPYAKW